MQLCSYSSELDALYQDLDKFVARNQETAGVRSLGSSAEGYDIKAIYVTDREVPLEEKEIAMIICGRHGNERGAFAVGPELLEWLVSREGASTRNRQFVVVVPVANPDGFVRGEFLAPRDKLSVTEINAINALVKDWQPDAVIDVHSLGRADLEAVITAHTSHQGEDDFIHGMVASDMVRGAASQGYPFALHTLGTQKFIPWVNIGYNNFFCQELYDRFHPLVFGMEVNHFALDIADAARSGLAAITPLLETGNRRFPWEYCAGYPNRILVGNFLTSIRAAGKNSAERRRSRSEIWKNRKFFTEPKRVMPSRRMVRISTEYSGETLSCGVSLSCRIRGNPNIRHISLNNKKEVSFYTCNDDCSTYVFVDIQPVRAGGCEVSIEI